MEFKSKVCCLHPSLQFTHDVESNMSLSWWKCGMKKKLFQITVVVIIQSHKIINCTVFVDIQSQVESRTIFTTPRGQAPGS